MNHPASEWLVGLKNIATHLNLSVDTLRKRMKNYSTPIRKWDGTWMAHKEELRHWWILVGKKMEEKQD